MIAIEIRPATQQDTAVVLQMIRDLAEYEKLTHVVVATEDRIRATLFDENPAADVLLAYQGAECVGFAVFFAAVCRLFSFAVRRRGEPQARLLILMLCGLERFSLRLTIPGIGEVCSAFSWGNCFETNGDGFPKVGNGACGDFA